MYPKRFFKKSYTTLFCRECHDLLEIMIPTFQVLTKHQYEQIIDEFMEADEMTMEALKQERRKRMFTGICPKCFTVNVLKAHYIFPPSISKKYRKLRICEVCRKEISQIIARNSNLTESDYVAIHKAWLHGINMLVKKEVTNEQKNNTRRTTRI